MKTLLKPPTIAVVPKLQNTNPPEDPPQYPGNGPFCIRAHCTLVDNKTENLLSDLTGYDTNYDIVKKTQNICEKLKQNGQTCNDVNIAIVPTQKIKTCDGHLVHKNHIDNTTSIMFPK
jgi:hypothetical protein